MVESFNAVLYIMAITVLIFYNNFQASFEYYFTDKTMDDELTFIIANNKINIANAEDQYYCAKHLTNQYSTKVSKVYEPTNKITRLEIFEYQCNLQSNVPSLAEKTLKIC